MKREMWERIPEFSNYEVSNLGGIYNLALEMRMSVSRTNHGHPKITLRSDWSSRRYTRAVAPMVAEAFCERPDDTCDQVIFLDGNFDNLDSDNLAWRPKWFAWKYTRQLKLDQPLYFCNLAVEDLTTGKRYGSVVDAGISLGLLFEDVWRSTYTKCRVYPTGSIFEVVERV